MTEPGSIFPPPPGWWVRTDYIGVGQGTFGWSAHTVGGRDSQGHTSGAYGWSGSAHGVHNVPTYIGSASANGGAVTMPAHQVGDVLVVFASVLSAGSTLVGVPSAGGTVPTWTVINANFTGTSTASSTIAYTVATATNHTSGSWGTADTMAVAVVRNHATSPIGAYANVGGTCAIPTPGPTAPAITMVHAEGTSLLLHFFGLQVGGGWNNFSATPPSGYTIRTATGAGTWGAVLLDTKNTTLIDGAVSHPTLDGSGSATVYRGATIEIKAY